MVGSTIIGFACGGSREFHWRKMFGWSIGNLLLGPVEVAPILSLNDWPARETYATCGGKGLVDRQQSMCCGTRLAPPAVDSREICEPDGVFAAA
jgi:hypothetical protein